MYNPIFDSKIEQNTAGRLVLHSFPSGADLLQEESCTWLMNLSLKANLLHL